MISAEVGLEALPNCYTSTIEVDSISPEKDSYRCHFVIKDVKSPDGEFSWYKNKNLFHEMKLMAVITADTNLITSLDEGSIEFSQKEILKIANTKTTMIKKANLNSFRNSQGKIKETEQGVVASFNYDIGFKIDKNFDNLKLYCAVVVNSTDQSLPDYRGPVLSEQIKQGGMYVMTSTLLRKPDGSYWSGPTHSHEGRLMEGSFHSAKPHDTLEKVIVYNSKIKDYRNNSYKRLEINTNQKKTPVFSNLLTSYGPDRSVSNLFSINIRSAILTKSFRAQQIASLNKSLFEAIAGQVTIMNLKVTKHEVLLSSGNNKIGTQEKTARKSISHTGLVSVSDFETQLAGFKARNVSFDEVVLNKSVFSRSFILKEESLRANSLPYRYKVSIILSDPFSDYLSLLAKDAKQSLKDFNNYCVSAENKSRNTAYQFSEKFINQQLNRYTDETDAPWIRSIRDYTKLMTMVKPLDKDHIDKIMIENLYLVHPKFGNKKSIRVFLAKFTSLYQHYIKTYSLNTSNYKDPATRRSNKNTTNPKIVVDKKYKNIISLKGKDRCIEYLPFENFVFPTIERAVLLKTSEKEVGKQFKNKPAFSGTLMSSKASKKLLDAFEDYQDTLVTYVNPSTIQDKKKKVKVNDFNTIDSDALNELIDVTDAANQKNNSGLVIRKTTVVDNKISRVAKKTKRLKQNLGNDSKFKKAKINQPEQNKSISVSHKTRRKFKKFKKEKFRKSNFSLKNKKILTRLERNLDMTKKIPLSLKSVYVSDSSNVKSDFIKEQDTTIENPKTINSFRVAYQTPVKIEFTEDNYNWSLLTNTKVLSLNEPKICRMSFLELQGITKPLYSFNIADQYFILKPDSVEILKTVEDLATPTSQQVLSFVNQEDVDYEYASSNIIQQHTGNSITSQQITPTPATEEANTMAQSLPTPEINQAASVTTTGGGY